MSNEVIKNIFSFLCNKMINNLIKEYTNDFTKSNNTKHI